MRAPRSCGQPATVTLMDTKHPGRPGRWLRPALLSASAYPARDTAGMLRLDAMENPYPLPDEVRVAWLGQLIGTNLNHYPDNQAWHLCEVLRAYWQVPPELMLLPGNGSDELIQLVHLALAGKERVALAPEPTFGVYRMTAEAAGLEFAGVPLEPDTYNLDVHAMLAAVQRHQPAVIWLANPNNPTGRSYDPADVRRLIEAAPGILVLDEAYLPYSDNSLLQLCLQYEHLLVLRTLSKMGLAGLRIGVLIGQAAWLEQLDKLRLPYNVGSLNQASAAFLLEYPDVLDYQVSQVCAARTTLYQQLAQLPGLRVWPSEANFFLLRVPDADVVCAGLAQRGVLVRNLNGSHPLLDNCLRVTVGTPAENQHFITVLNKLLAAAA